MSDHEVTGTQYTFVGKLSASRVASYYDASPVGEEREHFLQSSISLNKYFHSIRKKVKNRSII